ncbi:MAG: ATP-dependent zinc protease [Phycisphaerales bacterium]
MDDRPIIGRRERVVLPVWGIRSLRAKIDTGAYTSALHVEDLAIEDNVARFHVALRRDASRLSRLIETPVVRFANVRSSTGHEHERAVVRTTMAVAGVTLDAEFTLVRRHRMKYRMLIGRRLIHDGNFLVDVDRDGLQFPAPPVPDSPKHPTRKQP